METTLLQNSRLHYAEVYASDILELKNIFLQKFKVNKISKGFGIPFLLVRRKNEVVAFASLILNQNDEIDFEVIEKLTLNSEDQEEFIIKAKNYFKNSHSENFIDAEQLKYNIQRMIDWLND